MYKSISNAKNGLIWFVIATLILTIFTARNYKKITWTKPIMNIDTNIVSRNICYRLNKGWNDYVSINTIYGNGLFDIDTASNEIKTAFIAYGKIKSIHSYCKVIKGYVKFNNQEIVYSGGQEDSWQDRITKKYIEEDEKEASIKTSVISIPLTKNDLQKTITFDVRFDVIYPKLSENKNNFFNKEETIYEKYDIYIISQDEMKIMKEYTKWKNRSFHIKIFIVLAAFTAFFTFMIGYTIFYIRKN